jgi:hypothetical protein
MSMIRRSKKCRRKLIQFHLDEFNDKPSLLKVIVDDYISYHWMDLQNADEGVIQDRLIEYTGQTVPLEQIKARRNFMTEVAVMEGRNEHSRKSTTRNKMIQVYTDRQSRAELIIERNKEAAAPKKDDLNADARKK